jgi:L-threonylcarbamoyladenylate synthase
LIPYVLDGGTCKVGLESTIVGFEDNHIQIHRVGAVTKEQIEDVVGKPVLLSISHARPSAPGQLKSHYATHKPFFLGDIEKLALAHHGKKIGIISFQKDFQFLHPAKQLVLSASGDLGEAATNLFSYMRKMDESEVDIIIAEPVNPIGIGNAINDRLERAAYKA